MSNKLKNFIDNNRESLDSHEPRDLWNNINTELNQPISKIKIKKPFKKWFWGGIGSAVVVTAVCIYEYTQSHVEFVKKEIAEYKTEPNQPIKETQALIIDDTTKNKKAPNKQVVSNSSNTVTVNSETPVTETKTEPDQTAIPANTVATAEPAKQVDHEQSVGENKKQKKDKKKNHFYRDSSFIGITRLEIEGHSCDVAVKTHGDNNITFHADISSNHTKFNLVTEKVGTTLKVYFEFPHGQRSKVSIGIHTYAAILEFIVPAQMDVVIKNSSGNADVKGITATVFDIKTSLGDIKLENINAPNISVSANSGDIRLSNVVGNVKAETTLGDQKYENIQGNVISNSRSGDLIARTISGNITAETTLGNQIYENSIGDIVAQASSGDVRLTNAKGNYKLKTSLGDIIGNDVELTASSEMESSSGDIKMALKNNIKDLSFDLHSTSGDVSVLKGEEQFKKGNILVLTQGPILIKGTTKLGDQIFK